MRAGNPHYSHAPGNSWQDSNQQSSDYPCDRCIEQTGDPDPKRQSTVDGCFDEARGEKGQRDRHMYVALTAGFPKGVAVPASISDSHSRPRAIAVTSLTRVSERTGLDGEAGFGS
jgi:hypothetical protein